MNSKLTLQLPGPFKPVDFTVAGPFKQVDFTVARAI